jgi:hypothetical protein
MPPHLLLPPFDSQCQNDLIPEREFEVEVEVMTHNLLTNNER